MTEISTAEPESQDISDRLRAQKNLAFGLDRSTEEGDAEYWRRHEVYNQITTWGNDEPIIPGFTEADYQMTTWRPWGKITSREEMTASALDKAFRFRAVLDALDGQHEDRHWLYKHPFCRGCYPVERWADGTTFSIVEHRLAHWMLRNGERGFPADTWDGVVPPLAEPDTESLDALSYADLGEMPEPGWLIPDVLPDSGTGVLRARDQSFKSFMALSMALEIVMDAGNVLYCAGEGANQFRRRIDAWLEHEAGPDHDGIVGEPHETLDLRPWVPNLFTADERYERILADARKHKYDLIVIDTYARATAGSDLNSQGDQALVTARVDELRRATGGTVLLVAHSQKSDQDSSGSIEIEDARDFVFSMKRKEANRVTFEVTKQKDGVESPRPVEYVTKQVGPSIVLVEAGEEAASIMTTKDWIVAALHSTKALGGQTESQIRSWINSHEQREKPLTNSTCSSTLGRMVESGQVVKTGTRYSLSTAQEAL